MVTKKELLKAKQLLESHAPKGEFLAYINKDEAQVLKNLGGSGKIVEATQIPSFEITESRSLPPKFVEDLGKDYATQLTGLTSQKMDTTKFQPMVAGQDAAQRNAYNLATTQGQGIGAYAPYLQQAGAFQQGTGSFAGMPTNMMGAQDYLGAAQQQSGLAGLQSQAAQAQSTAQGALSGPNAYKQFMSPYQQDVINASMAEFDKTISKRNEWYWSKCSHVW